ncbi:MAG: HAMP domain-containing protein [Anaerolineales bacterium]|nr:HAMP domain-containing protein [Anaerolineales bacterium]
MKKEHHTITTDIGVEVPNQRATRGVLFRLVMGPVLIGILLLVTIAIAVWQLNVYNQARQAWLDTLDDLSLIADVRQDSTVLVLLTHRVAFTQASFQHLSEESQRFPTDSIKVSVAGLQVSRNNLMDEANSRSEGDPVSTRLRQTVEYLDKLIVMANESADLGMAGDWEAAQAVVSNTTEASTEPEFEAINADLLSELRKAQILIQQDFIKAEEQMDQASRTSITVTALAAGGVIILGVLLSFRTIRSINEPIRQLSNAAAQLAEGDFEVLVPVTSQDELGQLASVFNYMAAELQESYSLLEERAGAAEARLMQAIEGIPEGVVLYDSDDQLILCNQKYRDMHTEIADLIVPGAHFEDIVRGAAERGYYEDAVGRVEEWIAGRLKRHRAPGIPFDQKLSTGRWIQVSEYRTQEGGILGIRTDITDRKQAEVELREAKDSAEAARTAMSEFVSNASHELRTPLTHIYGFARRTQKDLADWIFPQTDVKDRKTERAVNEVVESIEIIVDEGQRMTDLIDDMLDLAKIEHGRMEWRMEPLSIEYVVEQALSTSAPLFDEKELELNLEIDEGIPEVLGDQDGLIRVMLNLISNAVKYTQEGLVTCKVRQDDNEVVVSVSDTGIGIAEEDFDRVFEKFAQAGDPLTDRSKGTGLGLPISKQIVEHHGGRIWLESTLGKGSTFSFSLPLPSETENESPS